jgi:hypothetical protein
MATPRKDTAFQLAMGKDRVDQRMVGQHDPAAMINSDNDPA